MKIITLSMLSLTLLSSCIVIHTQGRAVDETRFKKGAAKETDYSGRRMESREFSVSGFSEISVSSGMRFYVKKGDRQRVVVNTNAPEVIKVSSEGGLLKVQYNSTQPMRKVETEVVVYTDKIDKLKVESAGKMVIEEGIRSDQLWIDLSSSGELSGNVSAQNIRIKASSASSAALAIRAERVGVEASSLAKVRLYGEVEAVQAEATSAAEVHLENLKYKNLKQEVTSLGKIQTK
ncbi:GIN domain-containing protein [Bergeyella sp. RCAD1439]|uniref:GIN domain-containing protein n=1 Tax=Bergeyella anatis TaxID=3113737 RepID=UPI002E16C0D2|nr:DUF2807 domain-containing protein [Bergeyella sp. RCAD1439]